MTKKINSLILVLAGMINANPSHVFDSESSSVTSVSLSSEPSGPDSVQFPGWLEWMDQQRQKVDDATNQFIANPCQTGGEWLGWVKEKSCNAATTLAEMATEYGPIVGRYMHDAAISTRDFLAWAMHIDVLPIHNTSLNEEIAHLERELSNAKAENQNLKEVVHGYQELVRKYQNLVQEMNACTTPLTSAETNWLNVDHLTSEEIAALPTLRVLPQTK